MVHNFLKKFLKVKLLPFFFIQLGCQVVYIFLNKLHAHLFSLRAFGFWMDFTGKAQGVLISIELFIGFIAIVFIGLSIKSVWKYSVAIIGYFAVLLTAEFVLQFVLGVYRFDPLAFLNTALVQFVEYLVFATIFLFFQKTLIKPYINK